MPVRRPSALYVKLTSRLCQSVIELWLHVYVRDVCSFMRLTFCHSEPTVLDRPGNVDRLRIGEGPFEGLKKELL